MGDFRKLRVWQAAEALAVDAHQIATHMHGVGSVKLRDQITQAAVSVPANIVEGSAHKSPLEFARFLRYSVASASETEGHAQLAHDLRMISKTDFERLISQIEDVRKMLYGLMNKLKS